MKLTIVGCSGSAPGPGSAASCYLVEAGGQRIVLDLGSGAAGPLQNHVRLPDLDAILLSHLHPDHCLDVAALSVLLRYGWLPAAPIPVYGPPGAGDRLATAYDPGATVEMFAGLFEFRDFDIVDARADRLGAIGLRTAPMNHPVPTVGVRLDFEARSIVYSGDTGDCPALIELARSADVLLCEASWGGDDAPVPDLHMSGRAAGEHAQAAGVGRLLLTHVPPWIDLDRAVAAARAAFGGEVTAVRAGDVFEI
jgi:ribonuclease BN (tRNA processing enzyme)